MKTPTLPKDVVEGVEPQVLTRALDSDVSLAIYIRHASPSLIRSLEDVRICNFPSLRFEAPSSNAQALLLSKYAEFRAQNPWVEPVLNDMAGVIEIFNTHIGSSEIAIRIDQTDRTMCPKFHVDRCELRMVTTYVGPGTEWVPESGVNREALNQRDQTNDDIVPDTDAIQRLPTFSVAVTRGVGDPNVPSRGLVHRSPELSQGERRLFLCVQPISAR